MKKVLSILMAFVFVQVQTWAATGGPFDTFGSTQTSYTGTYAGVMLPDLSVAGGGLVALDQNALGIFSLAIPEAALATGAVAFFNKGEVFTGKIVGVLDPEEGSLTALMEASAIRIITVEVGAGSAVGAFGSDVRTVGKMEAQIAAGTGTLSSQRIEGTAVLNSFSDANRNADGTPIISGQIAFIVDGFKQSATATTVSDINFNINASSTP